MGPGPVPNSGSEKGVETEPRGRNRTEPPIHSPAEVPHLHISTLMQMLLALETALTWAAAWTQPNETVPISPPHLEPPPKKVKVWGKQTGTHLAPWYLEHSYNSYSSTQMPCPSLSPRGAFSSLGSLAPCWLWLSSPIHPWQSFVNHQTNDHHR